MRKLSFIVPVAVVLIALFMSTVFIVDERNKHWFCNLAAWLR